MITPTLRSVRAVLGLTVAALASVSCASSAPNPLAGLAASRSSNVANVRLCSFGTPVEISQTDPLPSDVNLTVLSLVSRPSAPGASAASATVPGTEVETAAVSIQVKSGTYGYSSDYFTFVDHASATHSAAPASAATGSGSPSLGDGNLPAGGHLTASVSFEVPTGGGVLVASTETGMHLCGWATRS